MLSVTTSPSVASSVSEGSSAAARCSTAPASGALDGAFDAAGSCATSASSTSEAALGNTKTGDVSANYSARTSFDTATGEWALVIERHPPAVGVTVAEQKGFLSKYSAIVSLSMNFRNAFSMRI
jgi:hypothetical protein